MIEATHQTLRVTRVQTSAALLLGAIGLMITGLTPVMSESLLTDGRITTPEIGLSAMIELVTMGLTAGLTGLVLPPRRLREFGVVASCIVVASDLATPLVWHGGVLALRAVGGLAEGYLLWLAIALISRHADPARMAGIFLTGMITSQLVFAALLGDVLAPRFGAFGVFAGLAATGALAGIAAWFAPPAYSGAIRDASVGDGTGAPAGHVPNLIGATALIAILLASAGGVGYFTYLGPLAQASGLPASSLAKSVEASLVGQLLGAGLATLVGGRIHYRTAFGFFLLCFAVAFAWVAFGRSETGFIFATFLTGFGSLFLSPYYVPFTLSVDPSGASASMTGGAQLIGSALGPLVLALTSTRPAFVLSFCGALIGVSVGIAIAISAIKGPTSPSTPP